MTLAVFYHECHGWYAWRPEGDMYHIYFRTGNKELFNVAPTWFDAYEAAKEKVEECGFSVYPPNETCEQKEHHESD